MPKNAPNIAERHHRRVDKTHRTTAGDDTKTDIEASKRASAPSLDAALDDYEASKVASEKSKASPGTASTSER